MELEIALKLWPDHPTLLLEKARLIQLSEHGKLKDARRALFRATKVAESNPEAWIELGYYLLRVDDRAADAENKFDHAVTLGFAQLADAIAGKIDAMLDQPSRNRSAELGRIIGIGEALLKIDDGSAEIEGLRKKIGQARAMLRNGVVSERNGK